MINGEVTTGRLYTYIENNYWSPNQLTWCSEFLIHVALSETSQWSINSTLLGSPTGIPLADIERCFIHLHLKIDCGCELITTLDEVFTHSLIPMYLSPRNTFCCPLKLGSKWIVLRCTDPMSRTSDSSNWHKSWRADSEHLLCIPLWGVGVLLYQVCQGQALASSIDVLL